MIWELGAGYRKSQPDGQRDLLLQSVKQARLDPTLRQSRASAVLHPITYDDPQPR